MTRRDEPAAAGRPPIRAAALDDGDAVAVAALLEPVAADPAIGVDEAPGFDRLLDEPLQAVGRPIGDVPHPNGPQPATADLLDRHQNRLRHTPGQVDAAEVGKTRSLLQEDRQLVVNALKLAAANAERLVALRFRQYSRAPNDVFSIFRGLLHLPGTVRSTEAERLEVLLQRPDSPKVAHALEALLRDLNQDQARLFSDGPILHFTLGRSN